MLTLPTDAEIKEALTEMRDDGPVPLAQFIDRNKHMSLMLHTFEDAVLETPRGLFTMLKAACVLGMHVGIIVGERRGRHKPPQV